MKIAYVIDGSTDFTPSSNQLKNIYKVPFKGYNESGTLVDIRSKKQLEVIQKNINKQFVEPTPGIYRDLYKRLRTEGYDYIICIPQSSTMSISYKNAEYASRLYSGSVVVIDIEEYNLETEEVLGKLLSEQEIKESSNILQFTFDQLFDAIKDILVQMKLVSA